MNDVPVVAARLRAVQQRIEVACARVGRNPDDVELVAVSKFHPPEALRAAYAAGQRQFGESYAQELATKAEALSDLPELRFRFIGGLQTNKTKLLVQSGCSIDSLDNASAARALANRVTIVPPSTAGATLKTVEILLQVNVAAEPQKRGVSVAELSDLVACVRSLPGLDLRGLMTIPPADDLAEARRCFRGLRALAEQHELSTLSMGMSDDLEVAIEEGSTMLRVGTAIFGPRS